MNRRFLTAALPVAGLALAVAACGPGHSGTEAARASAAATSTQVQAARADAQVLVGKCQPRGQSVSSWEVSWVLHPAKTFGVFADCENIPSARRPALLAAILDAAKAAHAAKGTKADREAQFIGAVAAAVRTAQGVAASPSASAS